MKILPLVISTIKHPSECDTSKGEFQIPLIFKPDFYVDDFIKKVDSSFNNLV